SRSASRKTFPQAPIRIFATSSNAFGARDIARAVSRRTGPSSATTSSAGCARAAATSGTSATCSRGRRTHERHAEADAASPLRAGQHVPVRSARGGQQVARAGHLRPQRARLRTDQSRFVLRYPVAGSLVPLVRPLFGGRRRDLSLF